VAAWSCIACRIAASTRSGSTPISAGSSAARRSATSAIAELVISSVP
jgi:hypothetical protein